MSYFLKIKTKIAIVKMKPHENNHHSKHHHNHSKHHSKHHHHHKYQTLNKPPAKSQKKESSTVKTVVFIIIFFIVIVTFILLGIFLLYTFIKNIPENYPNAGNLDVLNAIIQDVGNYPLPPPGFEDIPITGTLNNFICSNYSLFNFNETQGNTTKIGRASCRERV